MDKNTWNKINADSRLIESMGGAAALADRLGYTVQAFITGLSEALPPHVKLDNPEIFLPPNNSEEAA